MFLCACFNTSREIFGGQVLFFGAFLAGGLDFGSGGHAPPRDFAPLPLNRSCLLESRCRGWSCERAEKQVAEEVEMRFSQPRDS